MGFVILVSGGVLSGDDKCLFGYNRSFYNGCLTELKHDNPFSYGLNSTSLQDLCGWLKRAFERFDKKIAGFPKRKTLKNPVQSSH